MTRRVGVVALALACAAPRTPGGAAVPGVKGGAAAAASFAGASYGRARLAEVAGSCTLAGSVRSLTPASACVGCHDGMQLPTHTDHAYAVDYDAARAERQELRPRSEVPAAIVFVDGTALSCTSCHDGRSAEPHLTAMSMAKSVLCLGCHALGPVDAG